MAAVHSEGEVLAPTEPVDDSEVGISPTGRPQSYKCEKCDRAFVGPGYLANHRRKNHGLIGPVILDAPNARFECPDCDRRFVSEDAYDEHRVDHARTAVVTCEKCQETFGSSLHLAAHRVREHSPQPVATAPAPVAAEETVSSAPVSVEASVLSEPETAAESAPETVRADAGELRTYVPLAPVVAQGEFACTEPGCGARFSTRFSLRAHTISHAQVLVCEVCGKSFTFITAHQAQAHSTVELAEAMFRMRTWCEETAAASEDAEARIALAREALGM